MGFNPFPNDKILDVTKLKASADDKFNILKLTLWEREKMLVTIISPFPKIFQKPSSSGLLKVRILVKGKSNAKN